MDGNRLLRWLENAAYYILYGLCSHQNGLAWFRWPCGLTEIGLAFVLLALNVVIWTLRSMIYALRLYCLCVLFCGLAFGIVTLLSAWYNPALRWKRILASWIRSGRYNYLALHLDICSCSDLYGLALWIRPWRYNYFGSACHDMNLHFHLYGVASLVWMGDRLLWSCVLYFIYMACVIVF